MDLIYGRSPIGSTGRRTLMAAVFALAAMVLLLWFGSLRGPGIALAAEFDTNGGQSIDERCFLAIPCWLHDGTVIGDQTLWEEQDENVGALEAQGTETGDSFKFQLLGTSLNSGGEDNVGRCLLPGIPCIHQSGSGLTGQSAGVLSTMLLQTY